MIESLLLLIAGVVLAWFGGEIFVRGGVNLALCARWPTAVIGVTVAAFGTSSPEFMVAVNASLDGTPQLSLGDVLGSNVVNVSLVLAIVLALSGMKATDKGVRRDWWMALVAPILLYAVLWDGWFSRLDACLVLAAFSGWLLMVVRHARAHAASQTEATVCPPFSQSIIFLMIGLGLLIGAAQFVVSGGKGIALALGWSPFVVGAVVVAIATSTPELATTLIARMRGHDDVGLGNILGSNIFNVLLVASVTALIRPYPIHLPELQTSLIFGFVTVLIIYPGRNGHLGRARGFVLLAIYACYIGMTLHQDS